MSDIANPRVENYYLHPKKYAWRTDSRLSPQRNKITEEESKITEVIKESFKMVINSNHKTESIEKKLPEDTPIDFSVKTVDHTEHSGLSEFESSDSSIKDDGKMSHHSDFPSKYPNIKKNMAVPIFHGKVTSPVPIYNGNSKYQRPKLRHMSGLTQEYSENRQEIQPPTQDASIFHRNSIELSQFQNSNHRSQQINELFDCDERNSQGQSPNSSRENSPEARSCSNSILQEALAKLPDERPPMNAVSSYVQKSSPSTPGTKPFHGAISPFLLNNPMLPDTGSLLSSVDGLIPATPTMANYTLLNGLGFSTAPINGINPFNNGTLPSTSLDTKIFQIPGLCDKKSSKPVRPFKAFANEFLYGMHAMGLPTVVPNSGYFKDYFQGSAKGIAEQPKNNPLSRKESSEASANSAINSSPSCNGAEQKHDVNGSGDSNSSYPDASGSVIETAESTSNGKRSRSLPTEVKDEAYWERRRKNNQAAKRSRDARRQKEDMVAQQAWLYREYNQQLSNHIKAIDAQNRQLQLQNHGTLERCRNLELQLRLANEKLAQTRCGKCGSRFRNDKSENNFVNSDANE